MAELHRRDVDRHRERQALAPPRRRLPAGLAQRPGPERHDQPARLRRRHELARRHQPARRVPPAQQRLDPGRRGPRQPELRLVVEQELPPLQRPPQLLLQPLPGADLLVHRRLEEPEPPAALALGPVQRQVGVPDQLVRVVPVLREQRDAHARRRVHLLAAEVERRLQDGQQLGGERGRVGRPARPELDQRELVPAEPGQGVAAADHAAEPAGDAAQQRVAGRVAEAVVDALEVVEVEQQHRHPAAAAPGQRQRLPEPVRGAARGSAARSARRGGPGSGPAPPPP